MQGTQRSGRRSAFSAARALLRETRRTTRAKLGASIVFGTVARVAFLASATVLVSGDMAVAGAIGFGAGILLAVQRAIDAHARVAVETDLYGALARALIGGDVLAVQGEDSQRAVFDGEHRARAMLAVRLPALVADGLASLVAAPLLVTTLPVRVGYVAALALVVLVVGTLALRGLIGRLESKVHRTLRQVYDAMSVALDGRLELVARGGEERYFADLKTRLGIHEEVASRSALGSALLGRAPVVAAAATVAFAALVDGALRDALLRVVLAQALVLAACVPPLLGFVLSLHDMLRGTHVIEPLLRVLSADRRTEVKNPGGAKAEIPGIVTFENVTFAYAEDAPLVLDRLSFVWSGTTPLVTTGPNGSGKSTLLRILIGLATPRSGVIKIGARALTGVDLVDLRRRSVYLPQRPYLGEPHASVRDALRLGTPQATDVEMRAAIGRVLLDHGLDALVGELSAGQRQRVALARVLLHETAQLILLDEPDANLDRGGTVLVAELARELAEKGKMVVVAAHGAELIELSGQRLELRARGPLDTAELASRPA